MIHVHAAGLVLFRRTANCAEIFLVHPGGPFWRNRDAGAWSIPKGLYEADEDALAAARREFTEETGFIADGPFIPLGTFTVRRGKTVTAWAAAGDCQPEARVSNTFPLEWPPKSGRFQDTPEVDRGAWFAEEDALRKIVPGQRAIVAAFYSTVANESTGERPRSIQTNAY